MALILCGAFRALSFVLDEVGMLVCEDEVVVVRSSTVAVVVIAGAIVVGFGWRSRQ